MYVSIETTGHGETAALYGWLRRDPNLTRHADVAGGRPADPTIMAALEVIDVVLTHATGIATLALSVLAWRQSRPRPAPVTITRPDGRTLTVGGDPAVTAAFIVAFLAGSDPATRSGPDGGLPGIDEAAAGRGR
jgi:hypothetical protein